MSDNGYDVKRRSAKFYVNCIQSICIVNYSYHYVCIGKDDNNNRLFRKSNTDCVPCTGYIFEPRRKKSDFGVSDQDKR